MSESQFPINLENVNNSPEVKRFDVAASSTSVPDKTVEVHTSSAPQTAEDKLDKLIRLMELSLVRPQVAANVAATAPVVAVPAQPVQTRKYPEKAELVVYRDNSNIEHAAVVLRVHSNEQVDLYVLYSNRPPATVYAVNYNQSASPNSWAWQDEQDSNRLHE